MLAQLLLLLALVEGAPATPAPPQHLLILMWLSTDRHQRAPRLPWQLGSWACTWRFSSP